MLGLLVHYCMGVSYVSAQLLQILVGIVPNYGSKHGLKYFYPKWSILYRPKGARGTGLTTAPCRDDNDPGMFSGHCQVAAFNFSWNLAMNSFNFVLLDWFLFIYSIIVFFSRLEPKYGGYFSVCKHGAHTPLQAIIGYLVGFFHAFTTFYFMKQLSVQSS